MKKNIILVVAVAIMATVYAIYFTDWFTPKTVQIFHTNRVLHLRQVRNRPPGAAGGALPTLIFGINQQLKLTEVKIVPAAEFQTNKNAIPVWHLISDSNSVPVKQFHYGQFIPGMKPAIKGARAQELETNVTYHLMISGLGNAKGEHDFEVQ